MSSIPIAEAVPPFPITDVPPTGFKTGDTDTNWSYIGSSIDDTQSPSGVVGPNIYGGKYTSDGWTRLTTNAWYDVTHATGLDGTYAKQAANLLNATAFPARTGFQVVFDYRQTGGHVLDHGDGNAGNASTGDGITMYLVDGATSDGASQPVTVGGAGSGLGYAANIDSSNKSSVCGVQGGYLGLGLDVFGNYAVPDKGNYGGDATLAAAGNYVGLRGSAPSGVNKGDDSIGPCNVTTTPSDQYPWIGGVDLSTLRNSNGTAAFPDGGNIWTGTTGSTADPSTLSSYQFRRVWITVQPTETAIRVTVYMSPLTTETHASMAANGTNYSTPARVAARTRVFSYDLDRTSADQAALPATLKLGFSASTGSASDYHDIRNIEIQAFGDAGIQKTVSGGSDVNGVQTFIPGSTATFTLTAANLGPSDIGTLPNGTAVVHDDLSSLPLDPSTITESCRGVNGGACVTRDANGNARTGDVSAVKIGSAVINQDWIAPAPATIPSNPFDGSSPGVVVTISGTVTSPAALGTQGTLSYSNTALVPNDIANETVDQSSIGTSIQRDAGLADTNLANNTSTVSFAVTGLPHFTQTKTVDKGSNSVYQVGDSITYTVTAGNDGQGSGSAELTDNVPAGVTVKQVSCTPTANCSVTQSGNVVSGQVTNLASGKQVVFTISGVVNAAGDLSNTATLTPTTPGCAQGTDCGGGNTTVTTTANPQLPQFSETKTADKSVYWVGDTVVYTVRLANDGPVAGTALMSDQMPSGIEITSATCAPGTAAMTGVHCSATIDKTTTPATVSGPATVGPGEAAVYTITGVVNAVGEVTNTATVDASQTDGCTATTCGSGPATVTITGQAPAWTLAKQVIPAPGQTLDPTGLVHPGDIITYQVTATSVPLTPGDPTTAGPVPGVIISDNLSDVLTNATFVANSARLVIGNAAAVAVKDPKDTYLTTDPFTLPGAGTAVLTYQVQVGAGSWGATFTNAVSGQGGSGTIVLPPIDCDAAGVCASTENHTNAQIFVKKVNPVDGTALDGASFAIQADNNGQPGNPITTLVVAPSLDSTGATIKGSFEIDDIAPATYWLVETKAPVGYNLLAQPVGFSVDATGKVSLLAGAGRTASLSGTNTITISDVPMLQSLPSTGGTAQVPFSGMLGAALLLLLLGSGLVVLGRRHRI